MRQNAEQALQFKQGENIFGVRQVTKENVNKNN
jgi:hypothetical protein